MMSNPVPFLDLQTPHRELEQELMTVFREALLTAAFIGGPEVESFEREFADWCGTRHCVGVANGTDAVRFSLMAAGVGRGDAVITVAHTFIATVEAISQAGAAVEFVDIDDETCLMSPTALTAYLDSCSLDEKTGRPLGRRTGIPIKAVVPVHLYGQMPDMDLIQEIAQRFDLLVIEDACQAHGAEYCSVDGGWRRAGTFGVAAAFSFYPGKNLGACGEAGAVTTNEPQIAQTIRMLRDHGQIRKYHHELEGYNGRLDAIHAGILRIKLRHLDEWNTQRRLAANRYDTHLWSCDVRLPDEPLTNHGVYHLYVVRSAERDALAAHLKEQGIATGLHYPVPLHLQNCYRGLGYRQGDLPVTELVASEVLSLPMFPGITDEQQERVGEVIRGFRADAYAAGGRSAVS
jgi:dTDP-4-amino-4,6-dideoxygalactose transaminase